MSETLIQVKNLCKLYGLNRSEASAMMRAGSDKNTVYQKTGVTAALWDINLEVRRGEIYVLIGLSGSGKSTLLRCFNRLNRPTSGEVIFEEKALAEMNKQELLEFRRNKISMVFQSFGLMSHRDVLGNVAYGLEVKGVSRAEREEKAMKMIEMVGLSGWEHKSCAQLSGGMRQRVGIARALANDAEVLLMDEPFSALDPLTRESLQDEVKNLQQKLNKTIVFVSHDMSEALKLADIIIFMAAGEIVQMASPEEMLEHPANDLVRTFMGKHTPDTAPSKVESFMRTNVFSVRKDRGVLECAERMARGSVDTLLVTDEQNRYLGTISIGDIRHWGRELTSIEPLIRQTARTVRVGDEAKESFDYLLDSGANYVVVLNADDTIAGIVTKTSVARSVAENLWGDSK